MIHNSMNVHQHTFSSDQLNGSSIHILHLKWKWQESVQLQSLAVVTLLGPYPMLRCGTPVADSFIRPIFVLQQDETTWLKELLAVSQYITMTAGHLYLASLDGVLAVPVSLPRVSTVNLQLGVSAQFLNGGRFYGMAVPHAAIIGALISA